MRLRLASRQSDLARWQAVQVARVLETLPEAPRVEFQFKSSLGDQNLDLPLAQMGSKGVFTEDFYEDLKDGRSDLVVHSWKDLPTEPRPETAIAFTLPRADVRDVLIVPEAAWARATESGRLVIFTSSPRRVYNLAAHLSDLLPGRPRLEFASVRGNVPTRLRKMHEVSAALVLAKAGLDRLLDGEAEGFLSVSVRALLDGCRFMVLPVSLNPPAPAQGALAVEIARGNQTMTQIAGRVNCDGTYRAVQREREVLRAYGGGCHQKIGVAVLPRPFGTVFGLRGETEAGETLSTWRLENDVPWPKARSESAVFPRRASDNSWFERVPLAVDLKAQALFVARADALPEKFRQTNELVWTAGVRSWARLAARGVWVSGCQDGLGEDEPFRLERLAPGARFVKLTHASAATGNDVATYALRPKATAPDVNGVTHFFWMSGTSFDRARELYPEIIANGRHACGPGATFHHLSRQNLRHPVKVFIGLEQFLGES